MQLIMASSDLEAVVLRSMAQTELISTAELLCTPVTLPCFPEGRQAQKASNSAGSRTGPEIYQYIWTIQDLLVLVLLPLEGKTKEEHEWQGIIEVAVRGYRVRQESYPAPSAGEEEPQSVS